MSAPKIALAKALALKAEGLLGQAHEAAAYARDVCAGEAKTEARRIANRIERALQQLERIDE